REAIHRGREDVPARAGRGVEHEPDSAPAEERRGRRDDPAEPCVVVEIEPVGRLDDREEVPPPDRARRPPRGRAHRASMLTGSTSATPPEDRPDRAGANERQGMVHLYLWRRLARCANIERAGDSPRRHGGTEVQFSVSPCLRGELSAAPDEQRMT